MYLFVNYSQFYQPGQIPETAESQSQLLTL